MVTGKRKTFSSSCPKPRNDELRFEGSSGIVELVELPCRSIGVAYRKAARVGPAVSQRAKDWWAAAWGVWVLGSLLRAKMCCLQSYM